MPDTLDQLRHGRRLSATLRGALQLPLLRTGLALGLFEALRNPKSALELADRQGLAEDLVAAWLRAVHAHDLVSRQGERYRIGSFVRWLLDSRDAAAVHAMLDQTQLSYVPLLERLPELLKGGERPAFGAPDEAMRAAAVARLFERRALDALARVPGVRRARRVLDIGCGHGTYLAGLLRRYRDAQGLGVELDESVAVQARRTLREAEVSRRADVRVGDFMSLDLPAGSYDLALLNNDLHYFSPTQRRALLARVLERLTPRGILAIQTAVLSESALARALGTSATIAGFDLFLRAHRNLYGLPEPEALAEMLREVGFDEVGEVSIVPGGGARYFWARAPA